MTHLRPLIFSRHALERCLERGITPETVILTVEEGEVVRVERDAIMYRRGSVRVVVGLDGGIVTAFRRRPSTHKRTAKRKRQEKRSHFRFFKKHTEKKRPERRRLREE